MDRTGIKFLAEGEWKRKKHGAVYRRQWRKVYLGIVAHTLEIRAIEVTDNSVGDAPMLPKLLSQMPGDEAVASVSADGAYDTRACRTAIATRGAQALIPRERTANLGRRPSWVRACATRCTKLVVGWGGSSRRSGAATTVEVWWLSCMCG